MRASLSGRGDAGPDRGGAAAAWLRHGVVIWLAVGEPLLLALTLDRVLPRLALLGARGWTVVAARVALAAFGIAVARRLRAGDDGAWRGVSAWALAAIGVTLLALAWRELPSDLAPSEARRVAYAAMALEAALGVVAWRLARRAARARNSS
jgi:hypothetical protein